MPLESLHEVVEKLRIRIEAHGDVLRKNETQTRYALIDPLLRELGWDIEDPDQVRPEYPLRTEYNPATNSADYALLSNGRAAMMVEAKKLGTPLRDSVLQTINYCNMVGTEHFAVTDGRLWEIYETHKQGDIDQKRIVDFDLRETDTSQICLDALVLWRPSVQSGHAAPGKAPAIGIPADHAAATPSPVPAEAIPEQNQIVPDSHQWQELFSVTEKEEQKPVEMLFPDNSRAEMRNWRSALTEVVRWLVNRRMLHESNCPIKKSRATRNMVNTEPIHSNGVPFRTAREVGGLYVELNHSRRGLLDSTKTIIEHVGQDPAQFKVRFS